MSLHGHTLMRLSVLLVLALLRPAFGAVPAEQSRPPRHDRYLDDRANRVAEAGMPAGARAGVVYDVAGAGREPGTYVACPCCGFLLILFWLMLLVGSFRRGRFWPWLLLPFLLRGFGSRGGRGRGGSYGGGPFGGGFGGFGGGLPGGFGHFAGGGRWMGGRTRGHW
jgi:hypothetical protein